ncbi:MAG: hypothetical protein HYY98_16920 [Burkholderiales bacterium]|nr:hypothetical protein [Burkholderiales bacterium]
MTVKALMPVRTVNLVAPLGHKPTDRHTTDTAAPARGASGAAAHTRSLGYPSLLMLPGQTPRPDGLFESP